MTSPNDTPAPKPCPFCGDKEPEVWFRDETGNPYVACLECSADGPAERTTEEAIASWNRRAPSPEGVVEAAQRLLAAIDNRIRTVDAMELDAEVNGLRAALESPGAQPVEEVERLICLGCGDLNAKLASFPTGAGDADEGCKKCGGSDFASTLEEAVTSLAKAAKASDDARFDAEGRCLDLEIKLREVSAQPPEDQHIMELEERVNDLSGGMCVINGQARACSPAVEARIAELEAEVERAFRHGFGAGVPEEATYYADPDAAWAEYQATRHPPKQEET